MNRYVGSMKTPPASRTPRRLTTVSSSKNAEAELERVRLEARDSGDERADAGGDADRGGEHVIDHQRGCGKQARAGAQVFAGDRVGSAAVRIGLDGLPVGEIHDAQQDDDADADREDVSDAGGSERDQQRERSFGSVGGGTERVEPENRDAGRRPNALFAIRIGAQGRAEQKVEDGHPTMIESRARLEAGRAVSHRFPSNRV